MLGVVKRHNSQKQRATCEVNLRHMPAFKSPDSGSDAGQKTQRPCPCQTLFRGRLPDGPKRCVRAVIQRAALPTRRTPSPSQTLARTQHRSCQLSRPLLCRGAERAVRPKVERLPRPPARTEGALVVAPTPLVLPGAQYCIHAAAAHAAKRPRTPEHPMQQPGALAAWDTPQQPTQQPTQQPRSSCSSPAPWQRRTSQPRPGASAPRGPCGSSPLPQQLRRPAAGRRCAHTQRRARGHGCSRADCPAACPGLQGACTSLFSRRTLPLLPHRILPRPLTAARRQKELA